MCLDGGVIVLDGTSYNTYHDKAIACCFWCSADVGGEGGERVVREYSVRLDRELDPGTAMKRPTRRPCTQGPGGGGVRRTNG